GVDDLDGRRGCPAVFCPAGSDHWPVERLHVVAHGHVGVRVHVPELPHELLVPAHLPLGGEVHFFLAIPAPRGADGAGPFEYLIGVDASTDGVLPTGQVPELALDGEAAMLDPCTSGDALNIKRDHPRVHGRGDTERDVLQTVRHEVSDAR